MNPDAIPPELREREQWICWRNECRECRTLYDPEIKECPDCVDDDGDPIPTTKRPYDPDTGDFASSTDPDTWGSFEDARQYDGENDTHGIGFVFSEDGTVAGVDIDGVRDPDTRQPNDVAKDVIDRLDSYTEVSPSGTGYHVLAHGFVPEGRKKTPTVEMYNDGRYFTVTGEHVDGTPETVQQRASALREVHSDYVADDDGDSGDENAPSGELDADPDGRTEFEAADSGLTLSDARDRSDKLDACLKHLEPSYSLPNDDSPSGYDMSAASLLYYYGFSKNQIGQILRTYRHRDKLERDDYLERTINTAWGGDRVGVIDKETDGGTAAASPTVEPDGKINYGDVVINKQSIISQADYDPHNTDLGDVKERHLAHAIAELIPEAENFHLLWSDNLDGNDPIMWGYSTGTWSENGIKVLRIMSREVLGPRNTKRLMNKVKHSFTGIERAEVDPDDMGAPDGTIPVDNGLLHLLEHDIDGNALEELQPEHRAIRQLPTAYDPDADYEDTLFYELTKENVRDDTDMKRLQEYAGYTLWHHDQPFGKALFLIGPTDSGKGLFLKVLKGVLGKENVAAETMENLLESRWGFAQLYGNVANIRNEVTAEGLNNVQRFKELTGGGDRVTAEYKNGRKFKFTVNQKFLFATNQIPSIKHAGDPFFNRLLFVQFPETVPQHEQITDAKTRILEDERSAVLNWMLEGLNRLMDQGHFTGERSIEEKKDISNSWGGLIDRFVHNVIQITSDPNDVVHKKKLFGVFDAFADWVGQDNELQQQTFTKEMKSNAGITDGESTRVTDGDSKERVFKGVKVLPDAIEELEVDMPPHSNGEPDENGDGELTQERLN